MTEKYIGVNAFISVLKERQKEFDGLSRSFGKTAAYVLEEIINKLQSFPTADIEPVVHAHWLRRRWDHMNDYYDVMEYPYRCSACRVKSKESTKRCPECGARMDEKVR